MIVLQLEPLFQSPPPQFLANRFTAPIDIPDRHPSLLIAMRILAKLTVPICDSSIVADVTSIVNDVKLITCGGETPPSCR